VAQARIKLDATWAKHDGCVEKQEKLIAECMSLKSENTTLLVENAQLRRQVDKLTARKPWRAT